MYVILTYDVKEVRVSKAMKICRKYLTHVQRSVFEGWLTESTLKRLKRDLEKCWWLRRIRSVFIVWSGCVIQRKSR